MTNATSKRGGRAAKDVEVLAPTNSQVVLESGTQVEITPLKSRQFFKLLRIITHGMPIQTLMSIRIDPDDTNEAFAAKMIATLAFAIPEAEDEAIDFINSMVKPVGIIERKPLSEDDKERNVELWARVMADLENPSLDDTLTLVEAIIKQEAPNLKSLGKRLSQMFSLAMTKETPGLTSTE